MSKLLRIYAVTSILFLLVLTFYPLKNNFNEWRKTQKRYNNIVKDLPQKVKPSPVHLQQIWAREFDRVDRCTTCHLGVENKKLQSIPIPFNTHPKIHHDINKFGCTICHEGQGLATNYADAHLPTKFWDKPVLANRYLESSCGQCHHEKSLKEAPLLQQGRELVQNLNCVGCHNVPRVHKVYAPPLDGTGSKLASRRWLVNWLKDPHKVRPETKMPNFSLSDEEIQVLADFLMSFKEFTGEAQLENLPPVYEEKKDDDDFINLGKTRFREARCISCHKVEGRGGHLAPDLAKIASKARDVWIFNYIKAPRTFQPSVEMPQYGFSNKEIAAVTAYIESEFVDWDAPEEEEKQPAPVPNFYQRGLSIFNRYNCGGCHQLSKAKVVPNRAPSLATIGDKPMYEIDFAESGIAHVLPDYINEKIKTPRSFGLNTRMPRFTLSEEYRDAITVFLLSLKKESLPAKYIREASQQPSFNPQGRVGKIFKKYSCLRCHSIQNTGTKLAPDLSIVGSQLQPKWVEHYFKVPYSLRPTLTERMPNLFISEAEIKVLMDYFYTVLLDDSLTTHNDAAYQPRDAEQGKGLFWEKYGCQSCHIVNGKGGYVGPPLDNVGDRLQPGWVLQWCLDPQKYKPDTLEPKSGMTEDDAHKMVAYLMSLKKAR
ncbi:MAG: cytochrome c [Calditrichaeota bacterium]|nr:cytochrome c [Calditrichota bacterium]